MSAWNAANPDGHLQAQKRYLARKQGTQTRLPSPWAWLGIKGAHDLVAQAYRVATWQARYQPDEGSTPPPVADAMAQFAEVFQDRFVELLSERSRAAGVFQGCETTERQAAAAAIFRSEVPADWRPEYPQFTSSMEVRP